VTSVIPVNGCKVGAAPVGGCPVFVAIATGDASGMNDMDRENFTITLNTVEINALTGAFTNETASFALNIWDPGIPGGPPPGDVFFIPETPIPILVATGLSGLLVFRRKGLLRRA
jgi:hypothetical protein